MYCGAQPASAAAGAPAAAASAQRRLSRRSAAHGCGAARRSAPPAPGPALAPESSPALSPDGMFPEKGPDTAYRALASIDPEIAKFTPDLQAVYTNDFAKAALFRDLESGRELYIDPDAVRADYRRQFAAHCAAVEATCAKLGIVLRRLTTDQPLELALFDFLRERMNRGKLVKRHAA